MKNLFILSFCFLSLIFTTIIGCSGQDEQVKSAVLKQPVLNINTTGGGATHGGSTSNKALDKFMDLPLLIWTTLEYRQISVKRMGDTGGTKENFCVINEVDGTSVEVGDSVEFIADENCFWTYFTSADGIPHRYQIGIVKIRIPETGKEVWTWRKAVEILE